MGVKGYWGAGVFVLVLLAIVVGALLMPSKPVDEEKAGLPQTPDELIAAARNLRVGDPESTIVPLLGEPKRKTETMPGLFTWAYGDVTVSVYKGKICGFEGCNLMTRGEMVPAELQTPENLKPKPLAPLGQSPAESATKAIDE